MKNEKPTRAAQAAEKYIVRFPDGMRDQIDAAAQRNDRSMNAEIVHRLQRSFESPAEGLTGFSDGMLLDAVLARFEAKVQITVGLEVADTHGVEAPAPTRPKKSPS